MRYGAALPAGSYKGPLGAYRGIGYSRGDEVSRVGATLREQTKRNVVGMAGLNGLGGANLCTDPGWVAAQNILGGAGAVIGGAAGKDQGWAAAGAGISATAGAWAATCAAEAAQRNQDATAANQAMLQAQLDQMARNTQQQISASSRSNEQLMAALLASQQRAPAPDSGSKGIDTNTLLIGAGVVGAAILAAVLLRR